MFVGIGLALGCQKVGVAIGIRLRKFLAVDACFVALFLTAKRWQVLAWDANPRGREKIDSKSREATAGVGVERMGRTPVVPSGSAFLHLGFASQAITCRPYRD